MNIITDRERRPDVDDMIDDDAPDGDDSDYEPDDPGDEDQDDDDGGPPGPGGKASGSRPEAYSLADHHPNPSHVWRGRRWNHLP